MFSQNNTSNRKQDMTIKSRYPGANLITAKADIIISLAYTLNKMNEKK